MGAQPADTVYSAISVTLVVTALGAVFAAFAVVPEGGPRATMLTCIAIAVFAWGATRLVQGRRRVPLLAIAVVATAASVTIAAAPTTFFPTSVSSGLNDLFPQCREPGMQCQIRVQQTFTNGSEELVAYGINLISDEYGAASSFGSAVVIATSSGSVRWKSPIEAFTPGYGIQALATDVTNHVFAHFAMTNHSSMVWVIAIQGGVVRDFGTLGGAGLKIDTFTEPDMGGLRRLLTYREGWPANTLNPTTSRDVFAWNGSTYSFLGCEHVNLEGAQGAEVIALVPAGSEGCPSPVGEYSVDLPGDRPPSASLP